ncbi:hypothetical protein PYCH_00450 [Pyrococcus yayanosii CH1]|uniref:Uncharacterized protein n=1 Tax=Pyrococcus yayanosii (strain CH1 / JCM 16557) TaxID=529709 RepID=F8AFF1_PYRYC|nr:hypothetical protein PYCH_00450 [Pyrococcus yayanosii CH1]
MSLIGTLVRKRDDGKYELIDFQFSLSLIGTVILEDEEELFELPFNSL